MGEVRNEERKGEEKSGRAGGFVGSGNPDTTRE